MRQDINTRFNCRPILSQRLLHFREPFLTFRDESIQAGTMPGDRLHLLVDVSERPKQIVRCRENVFYQKRVRFVDAKGRPAQVEPWLELIVAPQRDGVKEETAMLGGLGQFGPGGAILIPRGGERVPRMGWQTMPLRPDTEGRLTIPALVPGATYRLWAHRSTNLTMPLFARSFTVEAGKARQLEIGVEQPR